MWSVYTDLQSAWGYRNSETEDGSFLKHLVGTLTQCWWRNMLSGVCHSHSWDLRFTTANSLHLGTPLSFLALSNQEVKKHRHIPNKLGKTIGTKISHGTFVYRFCLYYHMQAEQYFTKLQLDNSILTVSYQIPKFWGKCSVFISKGGRVPEEWHVNPFVEWSGSSNPLT